MNLGVVLISLVMILIQGIIANFAQKPVDPIIHQAQSTGPKPLPRPLRYWHHPTTWSSATLLTLALGIMTSYRQTWDVMSFTIALLVSGVLTTAVHIAWRSRPEWAEPIFHQQHGFTLLGVVNIIYNMWAIALIISFFGNTVRVGHGDGVGIFLLLSLHATNCFTLTSWARRRSAGGIAWGCTAASVFFLALALLMMK